MVTDGLKMQLLFADCDVLETHMDALENLVRIRGGIEVLEAQHPDLALLINMCAFPLSPCMLLTKCSADYIPLTTALLGRRRFHTSTLPVEGLPFSPIALSPLRGQLEGLAHFDIYADIIRICVEMRIAIAALLSGELLAFYNISLQFTSQLESIVVIGTSELAWGRRCEVLKCATMAALLYLKAVSLPGCVDWGGGPLRDFLGEALRGVKVDAEELERWVYSLMVELMPAGSRDGGEEGELHALTPILRVGASMNGPQWVALRKRLEVLYKTAYSKPFGAPGLDERDADVQSVTALYEHVSFR